MRLTDDLIRSYEERGYLLLPGLFDPEEVETLRDHLGDLFAEESPRRVLEKDGETVRSVYGVHQHDEAYQRLAEHPRLVEPVRQLLGGGVYVHQSRLNAKRALEGDLWEWHQDYTFWREEDGMAEPRAMSAAVFLDDVDALNGPMFLVAGSHRHGVLSDRADEGVPEGYDQDPGWISNLTADIKYSLDREGLASLMDDHEVVAATGPAGSVLMFHGNLVHSSAQNLSPYDRVIAFFSYNHVENVPQKTERPEFLASRRVRPIEPGTDDSLVSVLETA